MSTQYNTAPPPSQKRALESTAQLSFLSSYNAKCSRCNDRRDIGSVGLVGRGADGGAVGGERGDRVAGGGAGGPPSVMISPSAVRVAIPLSADLKAVSSMAASAVSFALSATTLAVSVTLPDFFASAASSASSLVTSAFTLAVAVAFALLQPEASFESADESAFPAAPPETPLRSVLMVLRIPAAAFCRTASALFTAASSVWSVVTNGETERNIRALRDSTKSDMAHLKTKDRDLRSQRQQSIHNRNDRRFLKRITRTIPVPAARAVSVFSRRDKMEWCRGET